MYDNEMHVRIFFFFFLFLTVIFLLDRSKNKNIMAALTPFLSLCKTFLIMCGITAGAALKELIFVSTQHQEREREREREREKVKTNCFLLHFKLCC